MNNLRTQFLLDPDVIFLNHGSFGATPKPVFEVYQEWQRRLEFQPVRFLGREVLHHLEEARHILGEYLNTQGADVVYIPNTTYGINIIARSLDLRDGDEVLTTNHEYGACDKTWEFMSQKKGFRYIKQPISYPFQSHEEIIEELWAGVTDRTKVIYISHITSATAVIFPIKAICQRAREAGILTVIDGAHAPGQIAVDLTDLNPDFYCGNLHKWVSAPKGAAFIYAKPELQAIVEPIIVSWGWGNPRFHATGNDFIDNLQYVGTNDYSAYLSVPAAIQFQADHEWTAVRKQRHQLLSDLIKQVSQITGLSTPYPNDTYYQQMAIMPISSVEDLQNLKSSFYDQFKVEIPFIQWGDHQFFRASIQGYNTPQDIEVLLHGLQSLKMHH